jgi:hypothetical protein
MRPTQRFRLAPRSTSAGRSELWSEDGQLKGSVPGTHLEAQFAVTVEGKAWYLLLTSYDSPFEEMLHILLVDEQGRLVEQGQLGGAYAPGMLKNLRVVSAERLRFDFQGPVTLIVHPKPRGWLRRRRMEIQRSIVDEGSAT